MSSLHVLLPLGPASPQTEFPHLVTPDGRSVARQGSAAAALLPPATGAGSEVVAVVPASALSWHRVELPKGAGPRSPRLRAVLEGLLEDRLLDEPEQLHFALGPTLPDGSHWVAVCDRAWLRGTLQALESAGRHVTRVVPEFAPEGDPVLYAVGEPQQARWVHASADGVLVLPLSAASLALLPAVSDATPVVAEPAVAALAEQAVQRTPQLLPAQERLLTAARSAWDLAQFEFSRTGRARAFKLLSAGWGGLWRSPQWRPARWALAVLLVAQVVGLNAWAWRERSALAAKRDATRSLLTTTFPNVRAIVDAPVQMEREVAALRQATGGSSGRDLEAMLGALATAAPAAGVTAIEYSGTELRARGVAAGDTQALLQALRAQGYAGRLDGEVLVLRPQEQP